MAGVQKLSAVTPPEPVRAEQASQSPNRDERMNVLIIGAAGKTGRLTVDRAVAAGHTVTALVRTPANDQVPAGVRVVAGGATDPAVVATAMAGQDAVIDTVGGKTPWKTTTLERDVAATLLTAMEAATVRRLVFTSALGVGDSTAQSAFLYRTLFLTTFLRGSTADKLAAEERVRQAGVDFVLVRPAILKDGPAAGGVRVFTGHDVAHQITRADVAQFLVDQLESDTHLGQAVTIATR